MRVLLSSVPAVAHVLALVPLARVLLARGHDVALVSAPSAGPLLPPGVPLLTAGPDLPELLAPTRANPPPDRPDGLPEGVGRFFGSIRAAATLPHAREVTTTFAPDVVVSEGLDGVGVVLAAERGVPHATVSLGPVCMADVDAEIRSSLHEEGFALDATRARFDPWPTALRPPGWQGPGPSTAVRAELALPEDGEGPAVLPAGDGTAVLVTLGTLFATPESLTPIVDALTAAGTRVVVALPPGLAPSALSPVSPDRVVLRGFGPLGPLLAAVDAVVCHAGAATVLAAAIHGRPVVAVPQGSDHFVNARGVAASGIGAVVGRDDGPAAIAGAAADVVGNPEILASARRIADDIAGRPGWDVAAGMLEELARTDR